MNCRDFRDIADSYLSDELLTETNHDMIRHMESCSGCRDLIGARREIRSRLKSAVIGASEYQLDANFDHLPLAFPRLIGCMYLPQYSHYFDLFLPIEQPKILSRAA